MREERNLLTVGELKQIAKMIPDHVPHDLPVQITVCNTVVIVKDIYDVLQLARVYRLPESQPAAAVALTS